MGSQPKKKLYVGCSLTLADEAFKTEVEEMKDRLRRDWEVMQFLGLVAGTEADVYQKDIVENVGGCDAFVGVVDQPAIGLGWELCRAAQLGKPTLAVAHVSSRVSRLVMGAPAFHENMSFRRYDVMGEDVPEIIRSEFAHILDSTAGQPGCDKM